MRGVTGWSKTVEPQSGAEIRREEYYIGEISAFLISSLRKRIAGAGGRQWNAMTLGGDDRVDIESHYRCL